MMPVARRLSEDEINSIKVGRAIKLMLATDGWKYFAQILESRLETERKRLEIPAANEESLRDGVSRAMAKEAICGGILMLRYVLQTPQVAVESAEDLLRRNREGDDDDVPVAE